MGIIASMSRDDSRSHHFDPARLVGLDRTFAVDRLAKSIRHPPDQGVPNRDLRNAAGALDRVTFLDARVLAHQHGADVVLFEIECDAVHAAWELQHLAGHRPLKPVDLSDAVPDLDDRPSLADIDGLVEPLDLFLDDRADFFGFDLHCVSLPTLRERASPRYSRMSNVFMLFNRFLRVLS
jgi:hypothetical protein